MLGFRLNYFSVESDAGLIIFIVTLNQLFQYSVSLSVNNLTTDLTE